MSETTRPAEVATRTGYIAAAAIAAFFLYAPIAGLDGDGSDFLVLGGLRIVLFGALLAFALHVGAERRRLGRLGLAVAGTAALAYLAGAIGSVATDGWSYSVFDDDTGEPPWYAYLFAASGIAFALGTALVGIAGRSGGRLAAAVIAAGLITPVAFALGETSHVLSHAVLLAPWIAVALGLVAAGRRSRTSPAPSAMSTRGSRLGGVSSGRSDTSSTPAR